MAASPTSQKSFLMYNDVIDTAEALSDDVAGKLFKHVLRYANGLDPIPDNEVVRIAFVNIKRNMDQNKEKWEKRSQVNKENGQKGGRPSNDVDLRDIPSQQGKPIETQNNPVGLVETQNNPQKPVTVSDTVSVIDSIQIEKNNRLASAHKSSTSNEPTLEHPPLTSIAMAATDVQTSTKPTRPKAAPKPKADPDATYYPHEGMNAAIQEFIRHREEIKKPMTPRAVDLMLKEFKGFTVKECMEAIKTSIVGGYQGVFPKKESLVNGSKPKDETSGPNIRTDIDYKKGALQL